MKAERIETLDVRSKTSVADFFIICTGTSDTHVNAIVERVAEKLRTHNVRPLRTQLSGTGWELMDFGEVVFHVMREERRQFYDLETLWTEMRPDPSLP